MKKLKEAELKRREKQFRFNEDKVNHVRAQKLENVMNGNYYKVKEELGLIGKCGHGSDFDHETEHVFNDLRPRSKKGYQATIDKETSKSFKDK